MTGLLPRGGGKPGGSPVWGHGLRRPSIRAPLLGEGKKGNAGCGEETSYLFYLLGFVMYDKIVFTARLWGRREISRRRKIWSSPCWADNPAAVLVVGRLAGNIRWFVVRLFMTSGMLFPRLATWLS